MINDEILESAKEVGLKISADGNIVNIRHKFYISDISTLSVLCFSFGGLFLMAVPFINTSDIISKIIGTILGSLLFILSILTLLRQVTDGLKIKDNILMIQYNLKRIVVPLSRDMRVKMRTEIIKIRRIGTLGSTFVLTTYYILYQDKEVQILRFQANNKFADNTTKLCNELTRIINDKFR